GRTAGAATRPDPVVVVAADPFIQAYELLRRNRALRERLETVLHADVVVRELGFGVAVRVDERAPLRLLRAPIGVAAHTVRPQGRVIGDRGGKSCAAIVRAGGKKLRQERRYPGVAVAGSQMTVDGRSFRQAEGRALRGAVIA